MYIINLYQRILTTTPVLILYYIMRYIFIMFTIISILQGLFIKVVRELLQRQRGAGQPAGCGQEDSAAGHVSQAKLHLSLQRYKHGGEAKGGQSLGARGGT